MISSSSSTGSGGAMAASWRARSASIASLGWHCRCFVDDELLETMFKQGGLDTYGVDNWNASEPFVLCLAVSISGDLVRSFDL